MALLRMLAFRPAQPADARSVAAPPSPRATVPRNESAAQGAVAPPKKPEPAACGPAGVHGAPRPSAPAEPSPGAAPPAAEPAAPCGVPASAGAPPAEPATPAAGVVSAAAPTQAIRQEDTAPAGRLADVNPGNWHRLLAECELGGMARTVASHCLPEAVEGATLQLLLQQEHEILYQPQCVPGDGTGPEVVKEGKKVLSAAAAKFGFILDFEEFDSGVTAT